MFQTSVTASKRLRIKLKSCILMQLFEATCVRNLLIVKNLDLNLNLNFSGTRERRKIVLSVPYILTILSRSHKTLLQTSVTNIQNRKVANYFLDGVTVSGPTV